MSLKIRKAISFLLAVAMLMTMPISIQATELADPLNISETADSHIPEEELPAPGSDGTWPEPNETLLGLDDTWPEPSGAFTKPAKTEFNVNLLSAGQKPYWPEGSTVSIRERTYEQIYIEWTAAKKADGGLVVDYTVSIYKDNVLIRTAEHLSGPEYLAPLIMPDLPASNLLPETNYRFDIVAKDLVSGEVSEVLSQTISTLSEDGFAPPYWPTGSILTASDKTHNTVSLSWSHAQNGKQTDNEVTGYEIYQGDAQVGTVTGSSNTSYTVTGLSPDTTYTFKVQAVNEKDKWTIDGPSVTVTTNPQLVPGTTELRLNALRKNINGSLYMGDRVSLELIAAETVVTPTVKVTYEEWNAGRDAVVAKTKDVGLSEAGNKIYKADFNLTEGISKLTSLQAEVQGKTITTELNLAVAGRLKVAMTSDETEEFKKIIAGSFVRVSKLGTNSLTARFSEGNQAVTIEGLDAAPDYELRHFLGYDTLLHEASPVEIKAGLETELTYTPQTPARVKVRVVDDSSGNSLSNATVKGEAVLLNGGTYTIFARTDETGYATTDGLYFAQNVETGSLIKLEASYKTDSKNAADWYKDAALSVSISNIGDNELVIRLKKVPIVTLQGTVTNHKDEPIKNANVLMTQTYKDSVINTSCRTDDSGRYTMQVAKINGEMSVNTEGNSVEKAVTLTDGVNTQDVKVPLSELASLNLIVKTMNLSGITTTLDFSQFNPRQLRMQVVNITRPGTSGFYLPGPDSPYFRTNGKPGDKIRITLDGEGFSYGSTIVEATLDENNYAEVTAVLKQYGRITAYITDRDGKQRQGETRYLYVYTGNGSYVGSCPSSAPNLSGFLPSGRYKAVISWEQTRIANFSQWQDDPKCVLHSEVFTVQDGQVTDLGSKAPIYKARETRYFRHNVASGLSSSHSLATPGTIMTLRAVYDYDKVVLASENLKLVADIPSGTTLVEDSVVYSRIKGTKNVKPVIGGNCITLDLEDEVSAAGSLTYRVKVQDIEDYKEIGASFRLKYMIYNEPQLEEIGSVAISTKRIILNAPTEVEKADRLNPVKLSGLAPAGNIVELWDGNIKIGQVKAAPTGLWSAAVSLPDRGMPIFHSITAKTKSEGEEYTDSATVLVGVEGTQLERIIFTQGGNTRGIDPKSDVTAFPFAVDPLGKVEVSAIFKDGDKVQNVKIAGNRAERKENAFTAHIMNNIASIPVEYDEKSLELKQVLKYDHGKVPAYITEADVSFADGTKMTKDVKYEVGMDGYLNSLDLPTVNLTMGNVNATVSMKAQQVDFDPANAKSRTPLGNGMYAYDFSYELVDGKYVISAYLDRRLLPVSAGKQRNKMMAMSSVATGLKFVNTSIEVYSKGESLMGAFGDLSKSAKMAELLINYESVRPNLQPHMAEYYDNQLSSMGKDILMGKTLGLVGEVAGNGANFVPLVGQVVAGIAGIISGKLLGDMFDNEFDSDYNRLTTQLKGLSGWPKWGSGNEWDGWYWYDGDSYYRTGRTIINPRYIFDPSGYVYEGVEDNRIEGVTATALYLPTEKAADADAAKASTEWESWDAEWYLQENPLTTDADGKYAWDVPEGWWMVQFIKDGYQTAYSDALKVLPPQLDVNIPMVKLSWPQVEKTIWGSGGRYVDVYFSKYMDMSVFDATTNAVSLTDDMGRLVSGTVSSAVPAKTGVDKLTLTKAVRFTPVNSLEVGKAYELTVNKAVADYAGFSMEADYTETASVTPAALIEGLSGRNIEVQPGKDITQDINNAVTFTATDPAMENSLDKRLMFTSSDDGVVRIWGNGDDVKIVSITEGTAKVTATSVDAPDKNTEFNVTVKYPPLPIGVTHMTILNASGMALTDLSIHTGETYAIKPNLFPENATEKTITYSSDNEEVATVNASGVVRALAKGIAEIRVRTENSAVMQTIHLTVLPARTETGGNGGSGSSGTVTSSTVPASNGAVQVSYTASNGTAILSLTAAKVNEIIENSKDGKAVIDLCKVSGVSAASLSQDALVAFAKAGLDVIVKLPVGTITLGNEAAASVAQQASGSNVTIELKQTEASSLTEAQKKSVQSGDIVLDINLYSDTEKITNFDGMLTVQIPYTGLQPVAVWYLNDKGELEKLSCTFQDGVVSFDLDHLSLYVLGQDMRKTPWVNTFTDVKEGDWFYSAVSFCAEKGITSGTSATTFSPNATLTRGQFITMLLKAYGIEPVANPTDNFVDAGNTYYTSYLAAAKAKGISHGVGDNKFSPEKAITRQEMFTLMYNALKVLNKLPTDDNGNTLADFNDSGDVASWATDAMSALIKSGTISGSGGKLNPTGSSTRAQMAQVLYNLLEK